jgi:hypothetical protein
LKEPPPNAEVVAGAAGCVAGAGDPNIPVIPDPAFACVSFVPSLSDIPENDNSWSESIDIDSVDSDGWIWEDEGCPNVDPAVFCPNAGWAG